MGVALAKLAHGARCALGVGGFDAVDDESDHVSRPAAGVEEAPRLVRGGALVRGLDGCWWPIRCSPALMVRGLGRGGALAVDVGQPVGALVPAFDRLQVAPAQFERDGAGLSAADGAVVDLGDGSPRPPCRS